MNDEQIGNATKIVQCWSIIDPLQSVVLSQIEFDAQKELYTDAQPPNLYPSAHKWDAKKSAWVLDKAKAAEIEAQAKQATEAEQLTQIEAAINAHINGVVHGLGLGFLTANDAMKYTGYPNRFRPIAEAVGKWVAEIWYLAAQDKVAIVSGKKSIPTVDEALAQIPPLVMPEQQKVGE